MKFCLINNLYKPYQRGGSERVIEIAINELLKKHQILLLTTQPQDIKDCQVNNNLRICRLNPRNIYYILDDYKIPAFKKLMWHFFDLFNFKVLSEVRRELQKFGPEVVITHNLKGFSFLIPKIIQKLKIPWIHVTHDYQLIEPHGSLHRQGRNLVKIGLFLGLYSRITNRLVKSPKLVISPSKFVLDKHLEHGFFKGSKTMVLPNPNIIINSKFEIQNSKLFRLLYLGQVEPHKGIEFLVKTFLKWDNVNAWLTIAGSGSQLEVIKQLSSQNERIKILGKVNQEKVDELFSQTDVLVVPSIWWDNSPTVIYEAYSHQLPVLVSDSGGSKELVKENQTGWIFKSADENDLISKLNYLITIKDKLPEFGQNGYKFVQQFSADKYVDKLLTLCQSLRK